MFTALSIGYLACNIKPGLFAQLMRFYNTRQYNGLAKNQTRRTSRHLFLRLYTSLWWGYIVLSKLAETRLCVR